MRREYPGYTERGAEVLNLGPDDADAYRRYWSKHQMPFPGLADPDHRVAKLYQQPVRLLRLGRMPMQLVVDRDGIIRFRHEGGSMRDIASNAEIFHVLAGL
ncbi:MAG: redoxin domain-containing protein [Deltaproteobacteria bacterium]|nr:redoxin domain-containing protein [Deltaproteobacteria bacterium]MBW2531444.1 redoxin domain-containing protein [Deltaproteobacteria bacterium]